MTLIVLSLWNLILPPHSVGSVSLGKKSCTILLQRGNAVIGKDIKVRLSSNVWEYKMVISAESWGNKWNSRTLSPVLDRCSGVSLVTWFILAVTHLLKALKHFHGVVYLHFQTNRWDLGLVRPPHPPPGSSLSPWLPSSLTDHKTDCRICL